MGNISDLLRTKGNRTGSQRFEWSQDFIVPQGVTKLRVTGCAQGGGSRASVAAPFLGAGRLGAYRGALIGTKFNGSNSFEVFATTPPLRSFARHSVSTWGGGVVVARDEPGVVVVAPPYNWSADSMIRVSFNDGAMWLGLSSGATLGSSTHPSAALSASADRLAIAVQTGVGLVKLDKGAAASMGVVAAGGNCQVRWLHDRFIVFDAGPGKILHGNGKTGALATVIHGGVVWSAAAWDGSAWIFGSATGTLARTTDFLAWSDIPAPDAARITDILALSPTVWLIAKTSGLWRTADAGATWAKVQNGGFSGEVSFKKNSRAILALGTSGPGYASDLTGEVWGQTPVSVCCATRSEATPNGDTAVLNDVFYYVAAGTIIESVNGTDWSDAYTMNYAYLDGADVQIIDKDTAACIFRLAGGDGGNGNIVGAGGISAGAPYVASGTGPAADTSGGESGGSTWGVQAVAPLAGLPVLIPGASGGYSTSGGGGGGSLFAPIGSARGAQPGIRPAGYGHGANGGISSGFQAGGGGGEGALQYPLAVAPGQRLRVEVPVFAPGEAGNGQPGGGAFLLLEWEVE